jgi:hypothetical protein
MKKRKRRTVTETIKDSHGLTIAKILIEKPSRTHWRRTHCVWIGDIAACREYMLKLANKAFNRAWYKRAIQKHAQNVTGPGITFKSLKRKGKNYDTRTFVKRH